MSRDFLDASIPDLVAKLSTEEKALLLSAPNWWNTHSIDRLKIPSVRMSDGPNVYLFNHFFSQRLTRLDRYLGCPRFFALCLHSRAMYTCT